MTTAAAQQQLNSSTAAAEAAAAARDTSTHTKLRSLPSLVLSLHDFGQLSNRGKPTTPAEHPVCMKKKHHQIQTKTTTKKPNYMQQVVWTFLPTSLQITNSPCANNEVTMRAQRRACRKEKKPKDTSRAPTISDSSR